LKRVHGGEKKYYHRVIGGNFRLDPIQAAVIRVKLPHLSSWHRKRRENAHYYNQLFEKAGLAPRILTPPELHSSNLNFPHIYNQYVIRAEKRDELQQYLRESDCASEVYYPIPFHLQECFSNLECDTSALKNSEEAAKTVLALPIYPELPREMQEYMVERIASFFLTH
jgi:dTDP-4-amino-4,6-dideoxygalactose transaminase